MPRTWALIGGLFVVLLFCSPAAAGSGATTKAPPFQHAKFFDIYYPQGNCVPGVHATPPTFSAHTGMGTVSDSDTTCGTGGNSTWSSSGGSVIDKYTVQLQFTGQGGTTNVSVSFALNYSADWNVTAGSCNRTVGNWHEYACSEKASWSISASGFVNRTKATKTGSNPEATLNDSWIGAGDGSYWGLACPKGQPCQSGSGTTNLTGQQNGSQSFTWGLANASLKKGVHYFINIEVEINVAADRSQLYPSYGQARGLSGWASVSATTQVASYSVS